MTGLGSGFHANIPWRSDVAILQPRCDNDRSTIRNNRNQRPMKSTEFGKTMAELCQLRDESLAEFQSLASFEDADAMQTDLLDRSKVTEKRIDLLMKYAETSEAILALMRQQVDERLVPTCNIPRPYRGK